MKLKLPDEVVKIINKFDDKGYEIYIVGGAVRDLLMGKPVVDWDYTTNATPEEILKLMPKGYYDNKFGTVGIPSQDESLKPHEITTFRHEFGYSDSRRPDKVLWGKNLKDDLQRRDFTINAIAIKKTKGNEFEIIDPFDGQKDLKKGTIRAVGDPNERFGEDALRMIRGVRFAAELNFKIHEETLYAIKTNSTLIQKIAKERLRDELIKILKSASPHKGFETLHESSLLSEIIPELDKTFGVEQRSPGRHHIYDVGTHSLMSLKFCPSQDPIVRFATLIHDIGKAQTFRKLENGTITFYNHEVVGAKIAKRITERLRFKKNDSEKIIRLVRFHQFTLDEKQTDSAIRRFITKVGRENILDMLDLRVGDRLGGGAAETSWRFEEFKKRLIEVQKQPFTVHDLKISGHDVIKELNLKPGPEIGKILNTLYNAVVEKEVANEKKSLLKFLKSLKN